MKKKHRINVTRTTEVQITITDTAKFEQDYKEWKNMYPATADEVTKEDFLSARAIISVAGGTSAKYNHGISIVHLKSTQSTEHIQ